MNENDEFFSLLKMFLKTYLLSWLAKTLRRKIYTRSVKQQTHVIARVIYVLDFMFGRLNLILNNYKCGNETSETIVNEGISKTLIN